MPNFNQCTFAGHLGRDPETRYVANEKAVCGFSIAVTEKWTKDGEKREETMWIDSEAWDKLAEICGKYLTKGAAVLVSGKLKLEKWDDKKDGTKRSKHKLRLDSMQMLGGKQDGEQADKLAPAAPKPAAVADDDEVPF